MGITSYRYGHATNSSSTHSIIVTPKNLHAKTYSSFEYGWEHFVLKHSERKREYVYTLIRAAFPKKCIKTVNKVLVEHDSNFAEVINGYSNTEYPGIDHQSHCTIDTMTEKNAGLLAIDLADYFLQDSITVIGGNDNAEKRFGAEYKQGRSKNMKEIESAFMEEGLYTHIRNVGKKHWLLYNNRNGTKITVSLGITDDDINYKPNFPELVDLKITNHCYHKCKFCYQNSSYNMEHAKFNDIKKIIDLLDEAGTLEIALAGGDPLSHPDITKIVDYIRSKNISANISVKGNDYCRIDGDRGDYVRLFEKLSGVGVSVHTAADFNSIVGYIVQDEHSDFYTYISSDMKVEFKRDEYSHRGVKYVAQHVFGSVSYEETLKIIQGAADKNIPLLLLGPKFIGRGKDFPFEKFNEEQLVNIVNTIKESKMLLSVDTAMIEQYPLMVSSINNDRRFYAPTEGKRSMYIDVVTHTYAPSSYKMDSRKVYSDDLEKIIDDFSTWN